MFLETSRFGRISYKKADIIWMARSLLGFEECKRCVIISIKGQEPFKWLQSLDDPQLAFLMIDPHYFKPDYSAEINPKDLALIGASQVKDIVLMVLVTIPKGQPQRMSANLKGPLAISLKNMHAVQVVLGESGYETSHPIYREIEKRLALASA